MTEIKDCLPDNARKHFINLRNVRLETETNKMQQRLAEVRANLSVRGLGHSSVLVMQEWKIKKEQLDTLATGYVKDA